MDALLREAATAGTAVDPVSQWSTYLEELKKSDPEEYELLVRDMMQFSDAKKAAEEVRTRPAAEPQSGSQGDEPFTPRMPGEEDDEGETVKPEPGFVVKTRTEQGDKIFINICHSPVIQNMSTKRQLAPDGTEQEGLNIPLSLGPPRTDKDKSGSACTVYDIIVNPAVVQKAEDDKTGSSRAFLCELALQYVEQKYTAKVDYRYKLPRMTYKGDATAIPPQLVRKRRAPVIEELVEQDVPEPPVKGLPGSKQVPKPVPAKPAQPLRPMAFSLHARCESGPWRKCEASLGDPIAIDSGNEGLPGAWPSELELCVAFPEAEQDPTLVDRLELEISAEFVSLRAHKAYQALELLLPYEVRETATSASYDTVRQALVVTLPVRSLAEQAWRRTSEPDPGSRAWLFKHALASDQDLNPADDNPPHAPGPQVAPSKPVSDHQQDQNGPLPEDRFHLADMLSQHIKDERERERREKLERADEEQAKKKLEEEEQSAKERKEKIQASLERAAAEIESNSCSVTLHRFCEREAASDDLLV